MLFFVILTIIGKFGFPYFESMLLNYFTALYHVLCYMLIIRILLITRLYKVCLVSVVIINVATLVYFQIIK